MHQNSSKMVNGFWFYSILDGWSTWQWAFLNFSQNFWSYDTPDTPGGASVVFAENEIWNNCSCGNGRLLMLWNYVYYNSKLVATNVCFIKIRTKQIVICDCIMSFWQIITQYCKFLKPRPLKQGILGASTYSYIQRYWQICFYVWFEFLWIRR